MFSTVVNISSPDFQMDYPEKILSLGSCFAENIGNRLSDAWFLSLTNPFGALYNPVSIVQSLELLLTDREFTEKDLFEHQSLWHSFAFSSHYSGVTPDEALQNMNRSLSAARYFLTETDVLILTFGTAWVYEDVSSGEVVANCHKLPANRFNRRKLSIDEIIEKYNILLTHLKQKLPQLQVIFTVSPIRHWKDGAHENTLSKSTLHLAVDTMEKKFDFVHYFPAYEIVMDELRDYRFYAADMLHPSDVAIDYLWKRFSETYFSKVTLELKNELEQLRGDLNHRPLHPESEAYQTFMQNIEKRKSSLIAKYPFLKQRIDN